ncbi:MAG TPA: RNA pseudouridine synthase [Microscillaceae bacterium]|jgi:23S rRNA pseudouridine1911/1915/1917 synthase|nr:RNA pseudouridine synthase [Microscillaceae bacterium]
MLFDDFFQVLYEDNHLLIVNKSPGVLVQPDDSPAPALEVMGKQYLKLKYNKPGEVFLGVCHRLDRPVSGLVILARTSKALERMNKIFRSREIQKTYWAVVKRKPAKEKAKLVHWIRKEEHQNRVEIFKHEESGSQIAELSYQWLGGLNDHHLLEVTPITGRPHQIRAQLAAIGCPIRGDVKYGFSRANDNGSIHLHARRVFFEHPVKKTPLLCIAPVPETQFWEQFLVFDKFNPKDANLDFLIS